MSEHLTTVRARITGPRGETHDLGDPQASTYGRVFASASCSCGWHGRVYDVGTVADMKARAQAEADLHAFEVEA